MSPKSSFRNRPPASRYTQPVATGDVTILLKRWSSGDSSALDSLAPLVYAELRRLAHRHMIQEPGGHTLQSTALVNEAFLRLIKHPDVQWQDRAHFFAVSSQMIRRILVNHARQSHAAKRGAGVIHIAIDENLNQSVTGPRALELIALDDALDALTQLDPIQSKVVELRFFGGLSVEETACALDVAPRTVIRYWSTARLWLLRELSGKNI